MVRKTAILSCAPLLALCLSAGPASRPTGGTVWVGGAVAHPLTLTADGIRSAMAAQVTPIAYDQRGRHHTAHAVPLLSVLRAAGVDATLRMDPKADPKAKNGVLRLAVVVRGRDGYATTFAMAELLPDIGDRPVWLALDADDEPLDDRSAPAALISPADAKPGRWVRGVASITVVDPSR